MSNLFSTNMKKEGINIFFHIKKGYEYKEIEKNFET